MERRIGWIKGLSISLLSAVLALLVLEGASRLYLRLSGERILTIPAEFYWENTPGMKKVEGGIVYEINSRGHRGAEYDPRKRSAVTRVVCLGDSSTFGFLNREEDTYARRLDRCLNAGGGRGYEVINAGVSGYTTLQEALALTLRVLPLKPDWVVLQCGHNNRSKNVSTDRSALFSERGRLARLLGGSRLLQLAGRLSRQWGIVKTRKRFVLEESLENVRGDLGTMIDRCRGSGARVVILSWGQHPDVERSTREGIALYRRGRYEDAIRELVRAERVEYNWDWRPAHYLKLCYGKTGDRDLQRRAAAKEKRLREQHPWVVEEELYLDLFGDVAREKGVAFLEFRGDDLEAGMFEDICHPSPEFTGKIAEALCAIIGEDNN